MIHLSPWRIRAASLPEEMLKDENRPSFALPGAQALLDFADLIGGGDDVPPLGQNIGMDEAPFLLPAMIPEEISGCVLLTREIDFGAIAGDRAEIVFDRIIGRGELLLGDTVIASFDHRSGANGTLTADLTASLRRGRRETIALRFDSARPAGVPGPVMLRTAQHASIQSLMLIPAPAQRTVSVRANICALNAGDYVLRLRACPADPGETPSPAREITFPLQAGEQRETGFAMEMPGECFIPGRPYAAPAVRAELIRLFPGNRARREAICDHRTLLCGYPGKAPLSYVPLSAQDCAGDEEALARDLLARHIHAVSLDFPACESFYRVMTRAGVAVRQFLPQDHPMEKRLRRFPCVTLEPLPAAKECMHAPDAQSAWQLCGVSGMTRTADPDLTPADLLFDAAGRALDPNDEHICAVLVWLRAVLIRLRAEASRQGHFTGALCAPGEWAQGDVSDALKTALRPLHLSCLPLLGAWWTGTRFSASLEAHIPEPLHSLHAHALLEDVDGQEIARFVFPVRDAGGYVGVIECALPEYPCALSLHVRLTQGVNEIPLEVYTLPIYVGERGALEAAF